MTIPLLPSAAPADMPTRWRKIKEAVNALISSPAAPSISTSATAITNGTTIPTTPFIANRVAPASNVTGIILQPGTVQGQPCVVINESANTVTFDVSGTSNVADGTSDVIAANTARQFIWNQAQTLWYRLA